MYIYIYVYIHTQQKLPPLYQIVRWSLVRVQQPHNDDFGGALLGPKVSITSQQSLFSSPVESRIGPKRGFGVTPGRL